MFEMIWKDKDLSHITMAVSQTLIGKSFKVLDIRKYDSHLDTIDNICLYNGMPFEHKSYETRILWIANPEEDGTQSFCIQLGYFQFDIEVQDMTKFESSSIEELAELCLICLLRIIKG